MQLNKMKELYATGEWICLWSANEQWWGIDDSPKWISYQSYKLIHKKHSEALDHVLNGGKVECAYRDGIDVIWLKEDDFIGEYDELAKYRIIKDKPSLNGHYCLATKAPYEKLVEDGYRDDDFTMSFHLDRGYLSTTDWYICSYKRPPTLKPMHLHKNYWVFGSLEHGKVYTEDGLLDYEAYAETRRRTKPVERITDEEHEAWVRERRKLRHTIESKSDTFYDRHGNETKALSVTHVMMFLDEYLKANQKDKSC